MVGKASESDAASATLEAADETSGMPAPFAVGACRQTQRHSDVVIGCPLLACANGGKGSTAGLAAPNCLAQNRSFAIAYRIADGRAHPQLADSSHATSGSRA